MTVVFSVVITVAFSAGLYLLMARNYLRMVVGFLILSQAVNLLLFSLGGLTQEGAPIIPEDLERLTTDAPEPLAQALILTAIVIGFAVTAFIIALTRESISTFENDDSDSLRSTE